MPTGSSTGAGAAGASWWSSASLAPPAFSGPALRELGLQPGLLTGLVDAGAPQLVRDEQQDEDPDRDQVRRPVIRRIGGA
jgi:hypothetical protein